MMSFALATAFFCVPYASAANSYYVATTGNDSNPGTEALPFLKVNRGCQALSSGDTLYIKAGTYNESIAGVIPSGSSASAQTTITPYGTDLVTLKPMDGTHCVIVTAGSSYITIKGASASPSPRLVIDMSSRKAYGAVSATGSSHDLTFENIETIDGGKDGDPAGPSDSHGGGAFLLGGTNHIVRACKIHDYGSWDSSNRANPYDHGIYLAGNSAIVEDCEIYNCTDGIKPQNNTTGFGQNNIIRFNNVHDNGCWGLLIGDNGNEVYGNLIWNNGRTFNYLEKPNNKPGGIQFEWCSDVKIYNNTLWNNYYTTSDGYGIAFRYNGGSNGNNIIRNNIVCGSPTAYEDFGGTPANVWSNNLTWTSSKFLSLVPTDVNFLKLDPALATDAINQGFTLPGAPYDEDYWGTLRPQGSAYDIGAHEVALYEAETLVFATNKTVTMFSDAAASAGQADKLNSTAINDYVTYTVPVTQAGTYTVKVRFKKYATRGKFQLAIEGSNQGAVQDQYASAITWTEVNLGSKTFSTAGEKAFKFTVTGKNASSTSYDLTFDYILLQ